MRHFPVARIAGNSQKGGELACTSYFRRYKEGWTIGWTKSVYTIACVDQFSSASRVHRLPARSTSGPGSKPHLSRAGCQLLFTSHACTRQTVIQFLSLIARDALEFDFLRFLRFFQRQVVSFKERETIVCEVWDSRIETINRLVREIFGSMPNAKRDCSWRVWGYIERINLWP